VALGGANGILFFCKWQTNFLGKGVYLDWEGEKYKRKFLILMWPISVFFWSYCKPFLCAQVTEMYAMKRFVSFALYQQKYSNTHIQISTFGNKL